jgi:hypothetical protein
VDFCVCAAGYGLNSGACALCPLGTFWPGPAKTAVDVGEGIAAAAVANRKKRATLSPCLPCQDANSAGSFKTLQTGATSAKQCVCEPGFGGNLYVQQLPHWHLQPWWHNSRLHRLWWCGLNN